MVKTGVPLRPAILAGTDLAIHHHARDGRGQRGDGSMFPPAPVRRFARTICRGCSVDCAPSLGGRGGREVGLRLLPVLQAAALGIEQRMLAGFVDARDLDLCRGGRRSFCAWTNSDASTVASGAPAFTVSPNPAMTRVTRPE